MIPFAAGLIRNQNKRGGYIRKKVRSRGQREKKKFAKEPETN